MRWVFALALVIGMVALIAWALLQGRVGERSPGWNLWLATVGAVAAAAVAAWYAGRADRSDGQGRS